jgi:GNAT superfamily N-acetyltransferase
MPNAKGQVSKVRTDDEIEAVSKLVWEFFDALRVRYPDMLDTIDRYIEKQNVAGELASFRDIFLPPAGECFVAKLEEDPVGMVMMKPRGDGRCELNRMYVRETARGLGLGRALCQALVDEARRLGYREVVLDALYRHQEALPLYESIGFRYTSDADAFEAGDDRVVHMRLEL